MQIWWPKPREPQWSLRRQSAFDQPHTWAASGRNTSSTPTSMTGLPAPAFQLGAGRALWLAAHLLRIGCFQAGLFVFFLFYVFFGCAKYHFRRPCPASTATPLPCGRLDPIQVAQRSPPFTHARGAALVNGRRQRSRAPPPLQLRCSSRAASPPIDVITDPARRDDPIRVMRRRHPADPKA